MFYSSPSTNSPAAFRTTKNYSQTYSGPIKLDQDLQRTAQRESMAKGAFASDQRAFNDQMGRGVAAGSKMANYRAGIQADAAAGKMYAKGQQDFLNRISSNAAANLQFQERQAGEQGYLRDLLLDRDDTGNRERMAAYKRFAGVKLADFQRSVEDAVASWKRDAMMTSALV